MFAFYEILCKGFGLVFLSIKFVDLDNLQQIELSRIDPVSGYNFNLCKTKSTSDKNNIYNIL